MGPIVSCGSSFRLFTSDTKLDSHLSFSFPLCDPGRANAAAATSLMRTEHYAVIRAAHATTTANPSARLPPFSSSPRASGREINLSERRLASLRRPERERERRQDWWCSGAGTVKGQRTTNEVLRRPLRASKSRRKQTIPPQHQPPH